MIEHFDIQRVSLGGPIFDVEKLNWLNGQWIKGLSPAELLIPYWHGKQIVRCSKTSPQQFNLVSTYFQKR